LDVDHPQLRLGKTPVYDPQALRNPRPDSRTDVVTQSQFKRYTLTGAPVYGLAATDAYLLGTGVAGSYAQTPDSAVTSVTGDIDVRVKVALDVWVPTTFQVLVGKYFGTNSQRTFRLAIRDATGQVVLQADSDGGGGGGAQQYQVAGPTISDGGVTWLRVTLDLDNGANSVATFYTSSDGINWAALGSPVTGTVFSSLYDSGAPLEVGGAQDYDGQPQTVAGKVYYAELRNGIGGTVVAKFDPITDAENGAVSFVSSTTGEVWTVRTSGVPAASLVVTY